MKIKWLRNFFDISKEKKKISSKHKDLEKKAE